MSGRIVSRLRERERNFDRAIDISRSIEKIANSLPMFRRVNALNTCNQLLQHPYYNNYEEISGSK